MLEEAGLESTLDWYLPMVERQTGIHISYEKSGTIVSCGWRRGHACVSGAAGSAEQCGPALRRQGGLGAFAVSAGRLWSCKWKIMGPASPVSARKQGIGLVAMRERAELLGRFAEFVRACGRWHADSPNRAKRKPGGETGFCMADKISVLLVDDHSLVRRGFRRMLEDEEDITVAGEASDGKEAVSLARELQPQVVVMDCALPEMNGLEATRKILEDAPEDSGPDAQHASRGNTGYGRRWTPARAATF